MTAMKKWRQYLLGHHFIILTDHRSLKELMSQVIQTSEQQIYLACLLGYDYSIQYQSGKANSIVDALSRVHETSAAQLLTLTILNFMFLQDLKKELHNHAGYRELWQSIVDNPQAHPTYEVTQDFILQQNRIWLPQGCNFISLLLAEFHSTPTGGHIWLTKTLNRIDQNFTWPRIKKDARNFVLACLPCQKTKYDHQKSPGLFCPLPVPLRPWEDLSLDFIGGLPISRGYTVILVVVDRFSKGVHLGML